MTISEEIYAILDNKKIDRDGKALDIMTIILREKETVRVKMMNCFNERKFTSYRKDKIIQVIEQEVL